MDSIVQKLIALEGEAKEAMNALEKEQTRLAQQGSATLARRISEIELTAELEVAELRRNAELETAAKISEIQAEYAQKIDVFRENLMANNHVIAEKIFHKILHG